MAAYTELSRTEYSWEELQVRPLPPGVDPAKIETYLNDTVFRVSSPSQQSCQLLVIKIIAGKVQDDQERVPGQSQVEAGGDEEGLRSVLTPLIMNDNLLEIKCCDLSHTYYSKPSTNDFIIWH